MDLPFPSSIQSRLTTHAIIAAHKGGEILKQGFGKVSEVKTKDSRNNLVTEYDALSEQAILSHLRSVFPNHAFLAEESGGVIDPHSITWVIDPLDGTMNFAHSIPMFAVSIAASYNGTILSGVVYHPLLHELFVAEKGGGAFLNGSRLSVSSKSFIDTALIATGFPPNPENDPDNCIELFSSVARLGSPLRRIGSAALDLSYVAAGRFDGFWEVTLQPWDFAAGKLLIEEAGGIVTNLEGIGYTTLAAGSILAGNPQIHKILLHTFTKHD